VDVVLIVAIGAGVAALAALVALAGERRRRRIEAEQHERRIDEAEARASAAEREREQRDLVLSSMREGVVLFGAAGETVYANAAAERHLGAIPRSASAVLPLALRDACHRALDLRETVAAEAHMGAPARWLRGAAIPVGGDGALLLVVRDVTEAKRVDAMRRDFVANASHELKTPAASIQAAAETISAAALDDPAVVPRFAAQLEREAARLSRIVSDLLDLSRLEAGSDLDDVVALDEIVRDELERFEHHAAEAGVRLTMRADAAPKVRGSARDLALLVRNLVDNAIRHTRPGGQVAVELDETDEDAALAVSDTGVGIPTRDLPRIFERFYRVDQARSRDTGGTGLGLSIVRHVVENHAGRVSVESELGRGTRFEVRIPAADR
jgi:signal transduction histidine kinase